MTANSTAPDLHLVDDDTDAGAPLPADRVMQPWQAKDANEAVKLCAAMPRLEYEACRKEVAATFNIDRVSALDAVVEAARKAGDTDTAEDEFGWEVMPATVPVDTAKLLSEIEATIAAYVVMPAASAVAAALWIATAWTFDYFDTSPLLTLSSPEKRCGKSTLLGCITALVPRPMPASNITAPALFRAVEAWRPTLLIDEADSFISNSDELRGVLNSGHTRWSSYVIRTVEIGGEHLPKRFSTWCPKVIALIGDLPDTLQDRSIVISMKRKAPGETVKKLRYPMTDSGLETIRRALCRWAGDNAINVGFIDAEPLDGMNDRAADNWRPLLTIAQMAGGEWPAKAKAAAVALSGDDVADTDSIKTTLLGDIRTLFGKHDRMTSDAIVAGLATMDDRRWPEWKAGKPITKVQLARLLKPFKVQSTTVRPEYGPPAKGYHLHAFAEAFERYLPPLKRYSVTSGMDTALYDGFRNVTGNGCNGSKSDEKARPNQHCNAVTDQLPPEAGKGENKGGNGERDYNTDPLGDDEFDVPAPLDPTTTPFKFPPS
jgi:putative DNA primase/helicase